MHSWDVCSSCIVETRGSKRRVRSCVVSSSTLSPRMFIIMRDTCEPFNLGIGLWNDLVYCSAIGWTEIGVTIELNDTLHWQIVRLTISSQIPWGGRIASKVNMTTGLPVHGSQVVFNNTGISTQDQMLTKHDCEVDNRITSKHSQTKSISDFHRHNIIRSLRWTEIAAIWYHLVHCEHLKYAWILFSSLREN
jgi:hypothetical protein